MKKLMLSIVFITMLFISSPTLYAINSVEFEGSFDEPGDIQTVSDPSLFTEENLSHADVYINYLKVVDNGTAIQEGWQWSNVGTHYRVIEEGDPIYNGAANFYYDDDSTEESCIVGPCEQGVVELWNADNWSQPVQIKIVVADEELEVDFNVSYNSLMGEVEWTPENPSENEDITITATPDEGYKVKYIIFSIGDSRSYNEQNELTTSIEDGALFDIIFVPKLEDEGYDSFTFEVEPGEENQFIDVDSEYHEYFQQFILYQQTLITVNDIPIVQPDWRNNEFEFYDSYFFYDTSVSVIPTDTGTELRSTPEFGVDSSFLFFGEGLNQVIIYNAYDNDTLHYYFDDPPHEITLWWDTNQIEFSAPPDDLDSPQAVDDDTMEALLGVLDSWGFGGELGTTVFFLLLLVVLNLVIIASALGRMASIIITLGTTSVFMLTGLIAWWVAILIFITIGFAMVTLKGRLQYD